MLPINQFDKDKFNQYYNNFDYTAAADYAAQFYVSNKDDQKQYLNYIRTLRSEGKKMQGIMDKANDNQKQAIQFYLGLENNNLPKTFINSAGNEQENIYTKNYVDQINNLGGEDATSIEIALEGKTLKRFGLFGIDIFAKDAKYKDSGFDLFSAGTGLNREQLRNMGVDITDKNGYTVMKINKDNPNFYKVMQGLQYVNTNRDAGNINSLIDENVDGENRYKIRGLDNSGNPIEIKSNAKGFDYIKNDVATFINDITNDFVSSDRDYNVEEFKNPDIIYDGKNIWSTINEARDIYKDFTKKDNEENEIVYDIQTMAVNGMDRARLDQLLSQRLISNEQYNTALKNLDDQYRLQLSQSLNQYEVYTNINNDSDEDPSLHYADTKDRNGEIMQQFSEMVADPDTQFQHAIAGGMVGTLVISPAKYKKENPNELIRKERRVFVKDFMKSQAEDAFRRNTKTRAQLELSDMQTYGYDYDIPNIGKIKDVTAQGAILETPGNPYILINRNEALNYLNKAMIYQDAIDMINQNYWYNDGKERDYKRLRNDVDTWAQLSMSELYPNDWQKYMEALQRNGVKIVNLNDNSPLDEQGNNDRNHLRALRNEMTAYILNAIGYNYNNN